MSKVALDEGVPEQIASYLLGHDVQSVRELRIKGTKNEKLLAAIAARGFEAFVSNDKRLEFDQNLSGRAAAFHPRLGFQHANIIKMAWATVMISFSR